MTEEVFKFDLIVSNVQLHGCCIFFSVVGGCDPNQQVIKAKGKTAMHAAAAGGYVDIMACLRLVIVAKK